MDLKEFDLAFSFDKRFTDVERYQLLQDGVDLKTLRLTLDFKERAAIEDWLQGPDHWLLTYHDPDFPEALKHIPDPPIVLYGVGQKEVLKAPQIAMVGARRMTPYGRALATQFAARFAELGISVVSGCAEGIDAAAHEGALSSGGKTVAIFGTGIDLIYPAHHLNLAKKIQASGCCLSDFPLGTPPAKWTFPRRNRLVSGLSLGTVVVEAASRSGSLITARLAGEQGKEVFACPGPISAPQSKGCHQLIQNGAHCATEPDDIIEVLAESLRPYLLTEVKAAPQAEDPTPFDDLSAEYLALLRDIRYDRTTLDDLVTCTQKSVSELSSMLLLLELKGVIDSVPGGYVKLKDFETVL